MADPHHLQWGAVTLWQQLRDLLPGLSVEVVARIGSTNTELLARARSALGHQRTEDAARRSEPGFGRRQGDLAPCLLVAEAQTQGRGRQGKAWFASAGASLTFSLALPMAPQQWSGLSLAVGLALAEALDPAGNQPDQAPRLLLKWPNDLLLRDAPVIGRKLGGILIETVPVGQQRWVVVGIGLNVQPQVAADGLAWGVANLQEMDDTLTAPAVLARVAPPLVQALRDFEAHGFAPLQQRYARRDALYGQAVTTTLAEAPDGQADGVDEQGMLWLLRKGSRLAVGSGEVSLRRTIARPSAPSAPSTPPGGPA